MNRIAFITGATSGIGEACARKFAEGGYDLILTARRADKLAEIKQELESEKTKVEVLAFDGRSLNFPWQAPEVLTKDGAYTIQEERDVRNAMQLCSESFDL